MLGLLLVSSLDRTRDIPAATAEPAVRGTDSDSIAIEELAVSATRLPVMETPKFDSLTLQISRGDTLDQLFREHNLDLGHLAQISRLDEAKTRLRRIKPGDVFEITHDDGRLVSIYSALDMTSALKIDREDEGFRARQTSDETFAAAIDAWLRTKTPRMTTRSR